MTAGQALLACCMLVVGCCALPGVAQPDLVAEWVTLEFDWQSMGEDMNSWLADGRYVPENCALAGVKVFGDDVFLTVPRWTPGVPSTLNQLVWSASGRPLLRPYPSLAANTPGGGSFVYVQSMEIDPLGRMWVLDTGAINTQAGTLQTLRAPRVVVLDITATPPVLLADVALQPPVAWADTYTFLNDIVVDWRRDWAYISVTNEQGGVIFFDLRTGSARRMTNVYTQGDAARQRVDFCGLGNYTLGLAPSDGIALSPDGATLYWCPLIGTALHAIDTQLLRDAGLSQQQLEERVRVVGDKLGLSDGMAMTSAGRLFYGNVGACALNAWQTSRRTLTAADQKLVYADPATMNWVDTFAFDGDGNLWFTTNRLGFFFSGVMDFSGASGPNFRLQRLALGVQSYMSSASTIFLSALAFCLLVSSIFF